MTKINRRDFLKAVGLTSTATAAGCSTDPISWDPMVPSEKAYPYIVQPEQVIPGTSTYFTTSCNQCSTGCGLVANVREGRVINIEGNKKHPTSKGKICFRGQTGLQETYSPDRLTLPSVNGVETHWADTLSTLVSATNKNVGWIGLPRSGASAKLVEQFMGSLGGKIVLWEPLGMESLRAATKAVFGKDTVPNYKLAEAHTIVGFGADFLGTWGGIEVEEGWGKSRDPENGFVSKMYTVGPRIGLTGSMTDHHITLKVGTEAGFALAIAKELAALNGYKGQALSVLSGIDSKQLISVSGASDTMVSSLLSDLNNKQLSIILPSGAETSHNSTELDTATLILNEVAGNVGKTITFGQDLNISNQGSAQQVLDLINSNLNTLFIDNLDLVYAFAGDAKVKEALAKVKNVILFSNEPNDSVAANTIVIPMGTSLEKWGDNEAIIGRHSLQQPVMNTVNGVSIMSAEDVILSICNAKNLTSSTVPVAVEEVVNEEANADASETDSPPPVTAIMPPGLDSKNFKAYVKTWWEAIVYPIAKQEGYASNFKTFWINSLQTGGYFQTIPNTSAAFQLRSLTTPTASSLAQTGELDLVLFPHPFVVDGKHANRPWAREIPDPLTGFSWGTWVEVHPDKADELGLTKDKGAILKTSSGEIEVGWFGSPGVAKDTIAVVMGGGKANSGRYAKYGSNPMSLIEHRIDKVSGAISYVANKATLVAADIQNTPNPQNHLLKSDTLTKNDRYVNFTVSKSDLDTNTEPGSAVPVHHLPDDSMAMRSRKTKSRFDPNVLLTDMYPVPEHPTYRFAMAIDLNKCNGCGACEAACYAENNIPVVGPDQIRLGRTMGWVRLSRYWEGDGENPDIRFQPVMCQQCSHAPCEGVCPVLATYHNLDGLNAMIYNRCVGTRYCGNNCPYSARRFNFHTYRWPESFNLMLNPDVVVREMGIMEKCTFCVQRIRAFKDEWRDSSGFAGQGKAAEGDYNRIAVCSAACPTDAITFGNLKDADSPVAKKFNSNRRYRMLEELNTKPGVAYLARIVHTESKLHGGHHSSDSGHGDHGSHHEHKENEHH
jgi:molybdopterin-containing oxidoreductase family iron-sulfur binding subunit